MLTLLVNYTISRGEMKNWMQVTPSFVRGRGKGEEVVKPCTQGVGVKTNLVKDHQLTPISERLMTLYSTL